MNTLELIKTIILRFTLNEAELFDEFIIIETNLQKNQKVKSFNTLNEEWTYILQTADIDGNFPNLKIVVEFLTCSPGSNKTLNEFSST